MRLSSIFWLIILLGMVGLRWNGICETAPLSSEIPATASSSEKLDPFPPAVIPSDAADRKKSNERSDPLDEMLKEDLLKEGEQIEAPFWKNFLYMLFILSFIVGLIFFLSLMMKKMVTTRLLQENLASIIKVLDKRSLSQKSMLYLIEIEGKQVLVGESINGITKLTEKSLLGDFSMADEETQASMQKIINARKENTAG